MEQDQPYDLMGNPPPAGPPPRRVPRVAVVVGLTAFLALAGAGVAFAVGGGSGSPASLSSSSSTSSTTAPNGPKGHMRAMPGFGPAMGLGGSVVHGEYTIKDGTTYKTVAEQVGQVTAVSTSSPMSLTVHSSDGFSQTYVVVSTTVVNSQAGGISTVAKNDTVRVEALVQGSTQTATNVVDTSKIASSRQGFGFGMGHSYGGPAGYPAVPPSPPSSAATA